MRKFFKKILPQRVIAMLMKIKNWFIDPYRISSYSQEGEDMILRRIFEDQETGFYVDVGAHHPKSFQTPIIFTKEVGME